MLPDPGSASPVSASPATRCPDVAGAGGRGCGGSDGGGASGGGSNSRLTAARLRRATVAAGLAVAVVLGAAVAAGPTTATAQQAVTHTQEARFDLVLRGLRAGVLRFSGNEAPGSYAVAGRLESTGLAGMVRKVRFDATARGVINGRGLMPLRYEEDADTGKRQSRAVMVWRGGVPSVEMSAPARPPRPEDVRPATQGGTVDPLTALYATLREVPAEAACTTNVVMFDGRRRSQLSLSAPKVEGDSITCSGEYRRLAGFSDQEMSEKTRFPFVLTYAPAEAGRVKVVEVAMDTLYGKARLVRR